MAMYIVPLAWQAACQHEQGKGDRIRDTKPCRFAIVQQMSSSTGTGTGTDRQILVQHSSETLPMTYGFRDSTTERVKCFVGRIGVLCLCLRFRPLRDLTNNAL